MYGTGILYPSPSKSIQQLPFARSLQGFMKRQHEFYRPHATNTRHVPGMTNVAARRFAAFDGDTLNKPEGADFKHPTYNKWTAQPLTFDASRLKNVRRMPGFALHTVLNGGGELEEPVDASKTAAAAKIGAALKGFAARKKAAARPTASATAPAGPAAAPAAAPSAAAAAPAVDEDKVKKIQALARGNKARQTAAALKAAKAAAEVHLSAAGPSPPRPIARPSTHAATPAHTGSVAARSGVAAEFQAKSHPKAVMAADPSKVSAHIIAGGSSPPASKLIKGLAATGSHDSAAAALAESRGDPSGAGGGGGGRPSLAPSDPTMAEFNAETNYNSLRGKFNSLQASAKKTGREAAFNLAKRQIDYEIHLDKTMSADEKKAAIRDLAKQFASE